MPDRPRYALGMEGRDKARWFALDDHRAGPMRTRDAHRARTWESPEALVEWLESIPDEPAYRAWRDDLTLYAVPVVATAGEPIPLFRHGTTAPEAAR